MKIYWKGKKEERIDILTELALIAYIAMDGSFSIVMTKDSLLAFEDALRFFSINTAKEACAYFEINFSPERLISDVDYIFQPEEVKEEYEKLSEIFKRRFAEEILEMAKKSGNLTRAEAVRIIWKKYLEDSVAFSHSEEADELVNRLDLERNMAEEWLDERADDLIIKYAIYLLMWEQGYGTDSFLNAAAGNFSKGGNVLFEEQILTENRIAEMGYSKKTLERKVADIIEKQYLSAEEIFDATQRIEKNIYENMKLNRSENVQEFDSFFYKDLISKRHERKGIFEFFVLFQLFYLNEISVENTKEKFDFLLGVSGCEYDVTREISQIISISAEIVLMNILNINSRIGLIQSKHDAEIVKLCEKFNKLQLHTFPLVFSLEKHRMEHLIKREADQFLQEITNDVSECNTEITEDAKKISERKRDMLQKHTGYTFFGGAYMHGARVEKYFEKTGKNADKKEKEQARSKDKSLYQKKGSDYWKFRKKGIAKYIWRDQVFEEEQKRINKYLQYLFYQIGYLNEEVRNKIMKLL